MRREPALMGSTIEMRPTCSIEVSGWDSEETFFVEQTCTQGSAGVSERVLLHHPIRSGAVLFLRLILPFESGPSFPVAYQVVEAHKTSNDGLWDLRLTQLRIRPTLRMSPESDLKPAAVLEERIN
jgi:hypothetical protein